MMENAENISEVQQVASEKKVQQSKKEIIKNPRLAEKLKKLESEGYFSRKAKDNFVSTKI